MVIANRELAERSRAVAAKAPNGSIERKAWGCAYIALSTTGTLTAAQKALGDVGQADVQAAALDVLGQLASEEASR